jgi:hypothetical protein|tara:strand:- start:6519 stop:7196 length:678 start_codon:yes stop_codon:yes gene_type:complete
MELSSRTVEILRNFSTINPNIVVNGGNVLKTMSIAKNIVSRAEIEETFPNTFGIYDLSEFLSVLSLVDRPSITFGDNFCTVSDGSGLSSVKYFYSDPEMLSAPKKDIVMPECEVKFLLTNETLSKIKRASSALGYDNISIKPNGNAIEISVIDSNDSTSNSYSVLAEGNFPEGTDFNFIMGVSNMKLLGEDYEVSVSTKLISHFKSINSETQYFIALEKSSTYGV